jgi:hypothetical protein
MAQPIDEIELAWGSLRDSGDGSGWRSISVASVQACELRAGRSFPDGNEALLAGFSFSAALSSEKLPEGHGFSVSRLEPAGDGRLWLALTRNSHGSTELFASMVADIVQTIGSMPREDEKRLLQAFLGRIRAWQQFMRNGAQAMSPEAEIGLVGELTLLHAIIGAGMPPLHAIESWVGPLDGIQDFHLGTGAIEVKTTLSSAGFPARIGSLEQLDDAIRQPIFLAGVRLRQIETGRNLPEFIAWVRLAFAGEPEAERLLGERLLAAGYIDDHADRYQRRLVPAEERVVQVAEGFPRMTHGTVQAGILRAMYEIDLDKAPCENVGIGNALKKLGVV